MTKIDIITGGCGFIGSHLTEKLLSIGRKVVVIDHAPSLNLAHVEHHDNLEIYDCDIRHKEFQRLFYNAENVYHLAALADIIPSIENPRDYYETNVSGTFNILEAVQKYGCKKFVYAASASCYGLAKTPTAEYEEISPQYPYALTKYLGEQFVMHWSKVYGINATSLRLFNVYGLRSRTSGTYGAMFGVFLAQLANKKALTVVGDGKQQRDFVHVSDVVNALITVAESDRNGIFNVGTGNPVSINRIVHLLGGEQVNIPKRPGEPDITCADISKIKRELGWKPKVSIEEGVAELLAHLGDYRDAPLWTPRTIKEATKEWHRCLKSSA